MTHEIGFDWRVRALPCQGLMVVETELGSAKVHAAEIQRFFRLGVYPNFGNLTTTACKMAARAAQAS